jgi:RNA polymerase sigma-70 factor (ECF subfamily)
MDGSNPPESPGAVFATTRWSLVLNAGDLESPQNADALAQLCAIYWYPVYAYIRRQGAMPPDAQDLTQEFFARLLERNFLNRVDRNRGKFRWYLLGAVKNFLSSQRERQQAAKRGGGRIHVPLDEVLAEQRYQVEPADTLSPEKVFERAWALTVLDRSRAQLRDQYERAGKLNRFERLEAFLPGDRPRGSYAETARELGVSEGALRVELHRLKASYRQLLRLEVAHCVTTPSEIDEELLHLIAVLQH